VTGKSSHSGARRINLTLRLSVIVAKMLQELPFEKRQGSSIARAWINKLAYDSDKATSEACALLHSLEFIPAVAEALEKDPESVIAKMNELRQYRMSFHEPGSSILMSST
jgi:Zn-dependent M16 (insulinase) family peptidase